MDLIKPLSPPEPRDVLKPARYKTSEVLKPSATLSAPLAPCKEPYERRQQRDRRRQSVPIKLDRRVGDRRGTKNRGELWRDAYLRRNSPLQPYQQKRLRSLLKFAEDPKWQEKRRGKGRFLDERV